MRRAKLIIDGHACWNDNCRLPYRLSLPTKETKFRFRLQQTSGSFPFAFFVCSKQTEIAVFRSKEHRLGFRFPFEAAAYVYVYHMYIYIYMYICVDIYIYIYIYICCHFKWKTEAQVIFLNQFNICSSCKQKSVVCLFVDKGTNRSYPLANWINGLKGLAHLCN
jgi:hypothetical protein